MAEATTAGRQEAAAVIWNWREKASATPAPGSNARARARGMLQGAIGGAIGGGIYWWWSQTIGTIVSTIAAVVFLSALISPGGLYAAVQRLFGTLGYWTGTALTWILMPALFYIFFLPFGALFRRGGRDRLRRYFDREAESYWEVHAGPTAASASRERQY